MPKLAITGGLATGKSTATEILRRLGAVALSADEAAREALAAGSPGMKAVEEQFGAEYVLPDGNLDRERMAALVFDDPEARARLEAISHPVIMKLIADGMATALQKERGAMVVAEIPLLYEVGAETLFDKVLVVTCNIDTQIARLTIRNGFDREEALRRISAQMPLAEKEALADYVVKNDGDLGSLTEEVKLVWQEMQSVGKQDGHSRNARGII